MAGNTSRSLLLISLLLNAAIRALCFQTDHRTAICNVATPRTCLARLYSKLFDENLDDEEFLNDNSTSLEGEAVAKSFFEELEKRNNRQERSRNDESATMPSIDNSKNEPSIRRLIKKNTATEKEPQQRKFTGANAFASQSSTTNSPQVRTPKESMMEREFKLVGRAEKGLAVQGLFAVFALAFYIYVGLSGGISNRSEESLQDFGGDDMLPYEQLVPLQKDREESVWL
eukprot:scaffold880_cov132-Cylindrotheca_fusiformis.AAC.11